MLKFKHAKRGHGVMMYETPTLQTREFELDLCNIDQMLSDEFRDELRAVRAIVTGKVNEKDQLEKL